MTLCASTKKPEGTAELHFFFLFSVLVAASMIAKQQLHSMPHFPQVLFTPAVRAREEDEGGISLNHSSSPLLVCL